MAKAAVPLVDHVFPPLSERPDVLSIPKRLRYCLECSPRRHREQHWPSRQGLLHAGNARDLLV
jgi:hypothetical protein